MSKYIAVFVCCLLLVEGCSSTGPQSGDLVQVAPDENTGFLVGSIGGVNDGKDNSRYRLSLKIREKSTKEHMTIQSKWDLLFGKFSGEIKGKNWAATPIAIPLKPGNYEIYSYELFYGGTGYGSKVIRPGNEFSIPFEISPNIGTYMGRWLCYGTYTKDVFKMPTGCNIVITENLSDDKTYIHAAGVPESMEFNLLQFNEPLPDEITFP